MQFKCYRRCSELSQTTHGLVMVFCEADSSVASKDIIIIMKEIIVLLIRIEYWEDIVLVEQIVDLWRWLVNCRNDRSSLVRHFLQRTDDILGHERI